MTVLCIGLYVNMSICNILLYVYKNKYISIYIYTHLWYVYVDTRTRLRDRNIQSHVGCPNEPRPQRNALTHTFNYQKPICLSVPHNFDVGLFDKPYSQNRVSGVKLTGPATRAFLWARLILSLEMAVTLELR